MIPHTAVTFDAVCLGQGTRTGMCAQTLPSMAHPGLAEVTYRSLGIPKKEGTYSINHKNQI